MKSLNLYPTRIEKVKSESRNSHDLKYVIKGLDKNVKSLRSKNKKLVQTEYEINIQDDFDGLTNSKCDSCGALDELEGDMGSPTMYTFKDSLLSQTFPEEAIGMVKIFKNTTKAERILKRLPSMSSFCDAVPIHQSPGDLKDTLIFSFYKLMRKNLSKPAYCYFLSRRDQCVESLASFSKTGDYKSLIKKIEENCQVADFV